MKTITIEDVEKKDINQKKRVNYATEKGKKG